MLGHSFAYCGAVAYEYADWSEMVEDGVDVRLCIQVSLFILTEFLVSVPICPSKRISFIASLQITVNKDPSSSFSDMLTVRNLEGK